MTASQGDGDVARFTASGREPVRNRDLACLPPMGLIEESGRRPSRVNFRKVSDPHRTPGAVPFRRRSPCGNSFWR